MFVDTSFLWSSLFQTHLKAWLRMSAEIRCFKEENLETRLSALDHPFFFFFAASHFESNSHKNEGLKFWGSLLSTMPCRLYYAWTMAVIHSASTMSAVVVYQWHAITWAKICSTFLTAAESHVYIAFHLWSWTCSSLTVFIICRSY